jgi:hypothetical protein
MKTIARYRNYAIVQIAPKKVTAMEDETRIDDFPLTAIGVAEACLLLTDLDSEPRGKKRKHLTFASRLFAMEADVRAGRDKMLRSLADQVEKTCPGLK